VLGEDDGPDGHENEPVESYVVEKLQEHRRESRRMPW
jgi:hypothetical protein